MLARGRAVCLRKLLKNTCLCFLAYANTRINDLETQCYGRLGLRRSGNADNHRTLPSEFDCIASKIGQDLTKSQRVPYDAGVEIRRNTAGQFQPLGMSPLRQKVDDILKRLPHIQVNLFEFEFPGFNL